MTLVDWHSVRLAVFDVDGTLYDQRALRLRMASLLLRHCLAQRSLDTLRTLKAYREMREHAAHPSEPFSEPALLSQVAAAVNRPEGSVRAIVSEWIHSRPLKEIGRLRYPGVAELFTQLRAAGKVIGVLSDHPAHDKMRALHLVADHVLSADDDDVKSLKPNPFGLQLLIRKGGASPASTIMVGDRPERDGEMGRRASVATYIRSSRARKGWTCFASFAQLQAGLPNGSDA